jgi:hypothetical protein
MKTEEKLSQTFFQIQNGTLKTNFFSRFLKKNHEILEALIEKSAELEIHYDEITALQRMSYIFREKAIKYCHCGKPLKWRDFTKGYNKSCGEKKCAMEENMASQKKTYLEKYGTEFFFQTSDFKNKLKKTFLQKYGTDNPFGQESLKDKIRKTNIERFGASSWLKNKDNAKVISEKLRERNRRERLKKIEDLKIPIEVIEFTKGGKVIIHCKDCGGETEFSNSFFNVNIRIGKNPCLKCNPPLLSESKGEVEFYNFIREIYDGNIEQKNRKILNGKEIDVFIPDLMIGFEFNGIYYHSELFKNKEEVLEKKETLSTIGINLITIWEDDWVYRNEIVKSRIINILGKSDKIYARKCEVKEIDTAKEKNFLEKNHIQGYVPSKIKLGLFLGKDLVSIMTFGNYRIHLGKKKQTGEYELLRFCNLLNVSIIGGASKLFSYFIQHYSPVKVLSYQNNSWNTGNLYQNLGFEKIGVTKQNYYWCKGNIRFNRFNFRKDKLIKEGYSRDLTEEQIMTSRSYFRIWDLGNIKWEYTKKV